MENNFILHAKTKKVESQDALRKLLTKEKIPVTLFCHHSMKENSEAFYHIEGFYRIQISHTYLSTIKKMIDAEIQYETLALFEFSSW